ncbi:VOC family protein [Actinacidiphila glaucinigra]|uniref:VOC family protein n=1 Tax=Actinacidiphila glaucinigra TaxID=235986 RepID=UPI0033E0BE26
MDTTTAGAPGTPYWAQLGSPDPQSAAAFYGALFGWDFTEDPARGPGHLTARLRGLPVAGLGPVGDLPRPGWTACFTVDDTDKAAASVVAAGGFALAELVTDDVDASAAFYGALFGWTAGDPAGPLGRREWRLDGTAVSLLLPRPAAMPREIPPYWDAYFTVTDVSAATARATRREAPCSCRPPTSAVEASPCSSIRRVPSSPSSSRGDGHVREGEDRHRDRRRVRAR